MFTLPLPILGVDLSILLVPLGALSIGLGLGLQSLASNYIAGMVLLFERTIRDGDVIEVDSIRGTVVETGLRATVVKTFGNTEVILPNSLLIAQRLDNWTKSDRILRIEAHIGVEYGSDIQTVHSILLSQIAGHPSVVTDPEPYSYLVEFADSALLFRILFWINDPAQRWSARSEILEGMYRELGKQSVVIPFPQRDIWFRAEPALGHANGQGRLSAISLGSRLNANTLNLWSIAFPKRPWADSPKSVRYPRNCIWPRNRKSGSLHSGQHRI